MFSHRVTFFRGCLLLVGEIYEYRGRCFMSFGFKSWGVQGIYVDKVTIGDQAQPLFLILCFFSSSTSKFHGIRVSVMVSSCLPIRFSWYLLLPRASHRFGILWWTQGLRVRGNMCPRACCHLLVSLCIFGSWGWPWFFSRRRIRSHLGRQR